MEKEKIYEKIPVFNQETEYIVQLKPVESKNSLYHGLKVKKLEQTDNQIIETPILQETVTPIFNLKDNYEKQKTESERILFIAEYLGMVDKKTNDVKKNIK
jgi:hypothetical protein